VVFTNRSATACQLQGVPMVRVLDAAGQVLSPPPQQLDFNGLAPVELRPGVRDGGGITPAAVGQAQLTIGRPTLECSPRPSATIVFVLPDDAGQLRAGWPGAAFSGPLCSEGLWVSPFGPAAQLTPTPTPAPQPDFSVEYVLPESVAIGETLKYKVVLTNVSGRDIQFVTCPSYMEFLKGQAFLHARYLLNCRPVGLFKSGETVTFAMEFPIVSTHPDGWRFSDPEWIQPGRSGLGWVLDLPFIAVNKTVSGQIGIVTLTAGGGG
jgi:hypothetical protein